MTPTFFPVFDDKPLFFAKKKVFPKKNRKKKEYSNETSEYICKIDSVYKYISW